jgi:YVTN family beta-propeller protein
MIATPDALWISYDGGLARVDPAANKVTRTITVAGGATYIAYGFGSFWVPNFDDELLRRVDVATGRTVAEIPVRDPMDLAATAEGVWVANHHTGTVSLIDPGTNAVTATVSVGPTGPSGPKGVAVIDGKVWVAVINTAQVAAIDPATRQVTETIPQVAAPAGPLAAMGSNLWVSEDGMQRSIDQVDLQRGAEISNTWVSGDVGTPLPVADGVWLPVGGSGTGRLLKLDAATDQPADAVTVPAGCQPDAAAAAFGSIWINCDNGTLLRLAPSDLP